MLKDAEVEDMLETIRAVFRGEAVYKTSLAAYVLSRVVTNSLHVSGVKHKTIFVEPLTERGRKFFKKWPMDYGMIK
ncbi:hypothetical protein [Bacillus salipaludis]|uniref:Uncharacterized protein n=1 Tax=Bacillus salipaludis TaxID=2547811 RepID=A0AA90R8S2_9BACI|nr:hypothetical protein [Bacillus salipaludis]MDQ6598716.1 hypothetical protein [Bacillus salipaludis]